MGWGGDGCGRGVGGVGRGLEECVLRRGLEETEYSTHGVLAHMHHLLACKYSNVPCALCHVSGSMYHARVFCTRVVLRESRADSVTSEVCGSGWCVMSPVVRCEDV